MAHIFHKIVLAMLVTVSVISGALPVYAATIAEDNAAIVQTIVPCKGSSKNYDCSPTKVIRTLPSADFRNEFLPLIARTMLYAMGGIAFVVFTIAGIYYAMGEEAQIKKAKSILTYSLMGFAFAAAAYMLVKSVLNITL